MSALREISLAKEIHDAGVDGHEYLYLGSQLPSSRTSVIDADLSDRLLRTYVPKDEIQRRIHPFIPPRSRMSHFFDFGTLVDGT